MIRKGTVVQWKNETDQILYGIVEETYEYKITRNRNRNQLLEYNTAGKALYIKLHNGRHVLRNDNEVERVD
ncbi:hypothetical protein J8281_00905 [Aquimarina sp. U1-2]|uniref:hypothetical protein n=1 Tax=Aquimarina sp. U1-2 TaxID=2823141 RepID=UPI001AEC9C78|nr:hypothetical protein [Aquimarina sp. U1-2]MBP2830730.1 hypothetical protein [Aquimarina sp. U1-2]